MNPMNRIFGLSICFVCLFVQFIDCAPSVITAEKDDEKLDYRLPTIIEPISYVIDLIPHFTKGTDYDAFTFDGNVDIELRTNATDVRTIVLHAKELEILQMNFIQKSEWYSTWMIPIRINRKDVDNKTDKHTFELGEALTPNKTYTLSFKYTGKLRTDMKGFYRSSYEENGQTKWLATTQMEPVHARKVFPCFDEPRFKAEFTISITRPEDFQPSISNTRIEKTINQTEKGLVRETFRTTPIMSTYLVAFIVSEFKCRENSAKTFDVCSRPNAYSQTEYSFDVGQKTLAAFDDLFQYKYSSVPGMEKMTMVALPDFSAGAMENWGLLTFRETALLYDPDVSSAKAQERVATVVAHEQAHMWFGDLVTCDWWEHTWLNEGFARFYQYFGTAMVETKWDLEQQFVVEQLQNVFNRDSLDDTHALNHEINSPDDIADMFGTISYNKGASVIRMIEHMIGHDNFVAALREYLKENEFKTAVPAKLYSAFQRKVNDSINIASIMGSWVTQVGYPVIQVNVLENRKDVEIKQKRFLLKDANHNDQTVWEIPLNYATSTENADFNDTKTKFTLSTPDHSSNQTMSLQFDNEIDWIIFNVQQTGYYRVNYDDTTWKNINRVLYGSHDEIHVLNRAQIVDDALNLARGNQLSYEQALHTIEYLRNEIDYVPWYAAFSNFNYILNRFKNDESTIFKNFILKLIDRVYTHLGFNANESDTRLDIYNRGLILRNACHLGHKQCIADAQKEFEQLKGKSMAIPADLVPTVYCTVISEGSDTEWDFLYGKFKNENVAAEQVVILSALGCTKQSHLIEKYFSIILTDSIRLQDKHTALSSTLSQRQNIDIVLDFVLNNHKNITTKFETNTEVPSILSQLASQTTSSEQIDKIEKFVEENENDLGPLDSLLLSIKNAKHNLKWAEENIPVIRKYLNPDSDPNSGPILIISFTMSILLPIFVQIFI